jgi:hypothetical protein
MTLAWRRGGQGHSRSPLLLKTPERHVIIAETEAKPEITNKTSRRMKDANKPVPERPGPDRLRRLYNRDLKK